MTRDEARALLAATPEYIPGPCPWRGAATFEEAQGRCRPMQMPCGDYECGTPDEGPNLDTDSGPLYQRNPEYDNIDGYLWHWQAYDDGYATAVPEWREPSES